MDSKEIWLGAIFVVSILVSCTLMLKFLNSAIAKYAQVEVIATYQVAIIVFTVICALVLVDEA